MKKNSYIFFIGLLFWICSGFYIFAQSASSQEDEITTTRQTSNTGASLSASSTDASPNIMLARSSADYQVTPGDVYTLAYAAGSTPVSYTITVDTSYRIRISNLGIINGAGKTFLQLKSEVETFVANNYPLSGVQLVLTQPAVFRVFVNGEVHRAGEVSAWGLSRLSTLAGGNLTGYASIRDISVKSSNGQTRTYDLFKARRLGDLNQDPYLRPGDIVTFNRIKRVVTINGAVERPGVYQLLNGENLKELITFYGNGFTPVADKSRSTLTRYVGSKEISGDIILFSEEELTGNYALCDMDIISIPSITSLRPAVRVNRIERTITIHGAVRRPGTYELRPDENLKELIEVYADGFTPVADKTRSTLTRYVDSKEISGDILLLSEQELDGDYPLQHMDEITIPSITSLRPAARINRIERTITINGAVRRPGTYELLPNENLKELIEVYADGFTPLADKTRSTLTRHVGGAEISGDIRLLSEQEITGDYPLQHMDEITIPSITSLRPAVYANRIERTITISGAVRRPGTYELMPNENLRELIEVYADGMTPVADKTRSTLTRHVGGKEISGDIILLTEQELTGDYPLQHMDEIAIPSITSLRPTVYANRIERTITINGAVRRPGTYELMPNENLKELIEVYGDGFTPVADLTRSTLKRHVGGTEISGDIRLLSEQEITGNYQLQHMDEITIPSITELRPAVHVNRIERTITINGAVRRPGTYELMPNENLQELIEVYADGFTPTADSSRIEMVRLVNSAEVTGDKIFLSNDDILDNYALEHLDAVYIPSVIELRSILFIEGAVDIDLTAALHTTNRLTIQFTIGDTYGSLIRKHIDWFSAMSDTQNSYILRKGERIPLNINTILYNISVHDDIIINDEDTLIVPFRQYFVSVSGAVMTPGRYPYIPERDWEYYIGLAGGFIPGRNTNDTVTIRTAEGIKMRKTDVILPETTITAETNHFVYYFNQYAPVITTILSILTSLFTVILITR